MQMKYIYMLASAVILLAACKKENSKLSDITTAISFDNFIDVREGNTYKTIKVGNQEWMAENLRYRMPTGSVEGCFTYGEASINMVTLLVDKPRFKDSVNAAIARGEIVNPPNLPAIQRPTIIIALNIDALTPRQLMERLTPYPNVVAVLERINKNLLGPAAIKEAAVNFQKAEQENSNYFKKYGLMYTYKAAQLVAPAGWRLPTDNDWKELEQNLGIPASELDLLENWRGWAAGRFLDKTGTGTGFNALLGGGKLYGVFMYGTPFLNKEVNGYYWTATEYQANDSTSYGIMRNFMSAQKGVWRGTAKKESAYHIKCIKIK